MPEVRVLDRQAIFNVVNRMKRSLHPKLLQLCNTRPCAEVALKGLLSEGKRAIYAQFEVYCP